jgi:hypothetical protein
MRAGTTDEWKLAGVMHQTGVEIILAKKTGPVPHPAAAPARLIIKLPAAV